MAVAPRGSWASVDVNPAVSFGAVLLGAALSGVAGAFLAVPVVAMMLALLDIYGKRYELAEELPLSGTPADERAGTAPAAGDVHDDVRS